MPGADELYKHHRILGGCIADPVNITLNRDLSLSVDINRNIPPLYNKDIASSVLYNKKPTKITTTLKKTGESADPFLQGLFENSSTVNIQYKLSDGTGLVFNDVKFEPASSTNDIYHLMGPVRSVEYKPDKKIKKDDDTTDTFSISEQMKDV